MHPHSHLPAQLACLTLPLTPSLTHPLVDDIVIFWNVVDILILCTQSHPVSSCLAQSHTVSIIVGPQYILSCNSSCNNTAIANIASNMQDVAHTYMHIYTDRLSNQAMLQHDNVSFIRPTLISCNTSICTQIDCQTRQRCNMTMFLSSVPCWLVAIHPMQQCL